MRVRIIITLLQFITCLAALVTKKITDSQAQQILKINEKLSNEWRLLNNLTFSQEGNDFSIVTYGGYLLITAVILLSRFFQNTLRVGLCEKLLLTFGVMSFLLQGCLVFASVEHVPVAIQTNAYILGGITIFGAILFLIDLLYINNTSQNQNRASQTDVSSDYTKTEFKRNWNRSNVINHRSMDINSITSKKKIDCCSKTKQPKSEDIKKIDFISLPNNNNLDTRPEKMFISTDV